MHAQLPERVGVATIDVAWTRQRHILPAARRMLAETGVVVSLIKPHYEAEPGQLTRGVLPAHLVESVVRRVSDDIRAAGFELIQTVRSPIFGAKGNAEVLALLRPSAKPGSSATTSTRAATAT
jgi:23S rRNA (cytidine1920-2'-O)/16S rRNA (cytidine1409-2'-O)-methyltransferase